MKHLLVVVAFGLTAGSELDVAVSEAPPIFDHLLGGWEGEGELLGRPSRFAMSWAWELDGRFLGLTYEIQGETRMQARAHYRVADGDAVTGVWVDSRGEILHLEAVATDSALTTIWRSPTETGRTIYRRTGANSLEVHDAFHNGTDWQLFGTAEYVRR